MAASWYAATAGQIRPRAALTSDLDIDVCVVGGRPAGLTAAREIARRGWSVVVLEARRIAAGASGRNTGFVLPGFAAEPDSIIARVGFERARDLWALSEAGLEYVRSAIGEDAMAGVDPQPGWLYVSKTDNGDEFLQLMRQLGEFGCEIEGWPTERVRSVLKSERYFHAIHFPGAIHINPLNYALGLAAAAERDGARIFEGTPALSIDPAGVRKRIVTPAARIRANHVVLCGNVQIGGLMPPVAAALLPVTTYVIATEPLGTRLTQTITYEGAVSDTDRADNHYRIVDGDRLMWSGRATTWARNARRYVQSLKADIRQTYPAAWRLRRRLRMVGHARQFGAPHAADRRAWPGRLARQRLRRARAQHHGDGRRADRARHRRGRSDLAAVRALRAGLGRRHARPRHRAGGILDQTAPRRARRAAGPPAARRTPARPRTCGR